MKKKLMLLFIALLALSWFSTITEMIQQPGNVAECLAKAEEFEKKEIYVDAISEYEQALNYEPDNIEIQLKMAEDYLKAGKSNNFESVCKDAIEAHPKDDRALERLMNYYIENSYEDRAVRYLAEYVESHPKNETAQSWYLRVKGSSKELYCDYDEMGTMTNDSMVVKKDEKYGLVDSEGSEITKIIYDFAQPYSRDGFALVSENEEYFYIDKEGQRRMLPDASYTDLHMYESDRTVAAQNGKYGYLDENMQPVTESMWDELSMISDNVGAGKKDNKWALLKKSGQERTEYIYDDIIMDEYGFCFRQKRAFAKENGAYYLIDKKGKHIGDLSFENAKIFAENGYAAVSSNGKWGYIDADGKQKIDYQYQDADSFHNGFAAVCVDGKWGFIDEKGNQIIKPQYQAVTSMSAKGTAAVQQDGEWVLIQLDIFG